MIKNCMVAKDNNLLIYTMFFQRGISIVFFILNYYQFQVIKEELDLYYFVNEDD